MRKIAFCGALLTLLVLIAGVVLAQTSTNFHLERVAISHGGSGSASSTNYHLEVTIGQTGTGNLSRGDEEACLGFWCGFEHLYRQLLPIIARN